MKTIECEIIVDKDRHAVLSLPDDIAPGTYTARIIIEDHFRRFSNDPLEGMPLISVDSWPDGLSLRREDQ